ncbi:MAG: ribosome recycling factor [Mycoplasmoidaceae bacterium]
MEWNKYKEMFEEKSLPKMEWLINELNKIRAGKITANVLDDILVEVYGDHKKIIEIANIKAATARQLLIKPYDPSHLREITHALSHHNIGANPIIDCETIKLSFPALTEETRKTLVKKTKEVSEQTKIGIRNIRKDIHNKINKDEELTKDDTRYFTESLDKIVKEKNHEIDKLITDKEKDLMTI